MRRLTAKTVVVLAICCFVGLVITQLTWMHSAYSNAISLYGKARKQFESELASQLGKNEKIKSGLTTLINYYENGTLDSSNMPQWFHQEFVTFVDLNIDWKPGLYIDG